MEPRFNFYLDRAISDKQLEQVSPTERRVLAAEIKTTPRQIWAYLSFLKYDRIKVYTGERVPQDCWDKEKQRVNAKKFKEGAYEFNEWLSSIESKIITEVRTKYRFQRTQPATRESLQALMKKVISESREIQDNVGPPVIGLLEKQRDSKKSEWTNGFVQIVNATIEHLRTFENWRKRPLSPAEDYATTWKEFKEYLVSLKFNSSTCNKYLKQFRRQLLYLQENELIQDVKTSDLPLFKELESFRIALKESEIEALAKTEYKLPHHQRARDLMIVQIFTGQRVGDLPQVLEQIKRGGEIHVTQEKTKKRITIPKYPLLEKHLKAVARRHPEGLEAFSDQKYNQYIKECCAAAGIDREHTFIEIKGDERVSVTKARFDLVSSHTCRRTFATLADKKGIGHAAIMQITGHASHKVFLEYIRIDDQDVNVEFNQKMK